MYITEKGIEQVLKAEGMNKYLVKITLPSGDKLAHVVEAVSAADAIKIVSWSIGHSYNEDHISVRKIDSDEQKEQKLQELADFMGNAMERLNEIIDSTFPNRKK